MLQGLLWGGAEYTEVCGETIKKGREIVRRKREVGRLCGGDRKMCGGTIKMQERT